MGPFFWSVPTWLCPCWWVCLVQHPGSDRKSNPACCLHPSPLVLMQRNKWSDRCIFPCVLVLKSQVKLPATIYSVAPVSMWVWSIALHCHFGRHFAFNLETITHIPLKVYGIYSIFKLPGNYPHFRGNWGGRAGVKSISISLLYFPPI